MEAVENQRQVYHRSHRPWKSLQDFHTPAAQRLLINKTKRKPAEVSLINCRPVCLSSGGQLKLSPFSLSQSRDPLQIAQPPSESLFVAPGTPGSKLPE